MGACGISSVRRGWVVIVPSIPPFPLLFVVVVANRNEMVLYRWVLVAMTFNLTFR